MRNLVILLSLLAGVAGASFVPLLEDAGGFAYLSALDTLTIDTAGVFQELDFAFSNDPMIGFELVAGPPAGIEYIRNGGGRWFEVIYNTSIAVDRPAATVHCGVAVNGTIPDDGSVMGTYDKTAGEQEAFGGQCWLYIHQGDVITLLVTTDGDGDEIYVFHYSVSISSPYKFL